MKTGNNIFDNDLLEEHLAKLKDKMPIFCIGVHSYENCYCYCLSSRVNGAITIILLKSAYDKKTCLEYEQEVISLQKIFNATVMEEKL